MKRFNENRVVDRRFKGCFMNDGMINNENDFSEPISTTENPDNQPIYIQIHHNYF